MATVTLFTNTTTDYENHSAVTGECMVIVRGEFDGAVVELLVSDLDDPDAMVSVDTSMAQVTVIRQQKAIRVDGLGTYYLQARLKNAGANTSLTCVAVN